MKRKYCQLGLVQFAMFMAISASGIAYAGSSPRASTQERIVIEDDDFFLCAPLRDYTKVEFDHSAINSIELNGRYHGQYAWIDADQGSYEGFETRRFRLGTEVRFLEKGTAFYHFNIASEWDRNDYNEFHDSVETYGVKWKLSEYATLIVGKHKLKITQEFATSSNRILTIERSALVNQIVPEESLGLSLYGTLGNSGFSYNTGFFSGDHGGEKGYGGFNAGYGVLASLGYRLSGNTKAGLDYFYQNGNEGNYQGQFTEYKHLLSLNSTSQWGAFGLHTDLIYALGDERPDVYGVMVMPFVNLTEQLQLVTRYQYSGSEGSRGNRLDSRYQREAVSGAGWGSNYHAIYAGMNYYLCGDSLKLMAGVEYAAQAGSSNDGGEFEGFQYLLAVRSYF